MSRLIDADKLKQRVSYSREEFKYNNYTYGLLGAMMEEIDVQPTVEPTGQWISVKDKLPNENKTYLVFAPSYGGCSSKGKESHDGIMFSKFQNGKWGIETGYHKRKDCVLYWMPIELPKEK